MMEGKSEEGSEEGLERRTLGRVYPWSDVEMEACVAGILFEGMKIAMF